MDFSVTDEQRAIRDTAQKFAADQLAPFYRERETQGYIDRALIEQMGSLGLIGAELPEAFGGLGASSVTGGFIIEDVSYADMNVGYVQLLGSLMGWMLASHAQASVAQEVVPR
ncbi:MAG: cyclohexanecarboxyl-CoA dehydrogenase, partial [Gammaproteobacteria bacterium]